MSDDAFLARWSRRKLAARAGTPLREAEPVPAPPEPGATGSSGAGAARPEGQPREPAVELPPIESLRGLQSDYAAFLRPGVDKSLRGAALRRLFSDPHFNVMDGLDIYIDDYSKPDPIPAAMLAALTHAKGLLFRGAEAEAPDAASQHKAVQAERPAEPDGQDCRTEADLSEAAPFPGSDPIQTS